MDRCALFVDAGYVLTDGAMAVHGTRRRESVTWDYAGLLQLLGNLATERTRLPLLRCYWYEATVEGRRSAEHDALADLPGVKLRVAKMRPGRREGVEGEIHRDLATLARNKAVSDVMVVCAEEDLVQAIADVQDTGMRVTLLHIAGDGSRTIARTLRQECDDTVELSAAQLRDYVELITGAEPPRTGEPGIGQFDPRPAMNGDHGANGGGAHAPAAGRPAVYAQPQGMPGAGQQPVRQVPQHVAMEGPQADPGQPERADAPVAPMATDYTSAADFGASVDYSGSVDYGAPAEHASAAGQAPAAEQATSVDYASAPDYGLVPDYAMPATASAQPREDIYAAPVALPARSDDPPGDRDRLAGGPRGDLAAYNPGSARQQYQREGMLREPAAGDAGNRLHPVPAAPLGGGPAQVRRLPAPGAVPGGPGQGQPQPGLPPAPADVGVGQQLGGQQSAGQQPAAQPPGAQPTAPVAPVVPMDPNGMGYTGAPGAPHHGIPGPNPNSGAHPAASPPGAGSPVPSSASPGQQFPQQPPIPGGQQVLGGQQVPGGPQEPGGQPGPIGLVGPGGHSGDAPGGAPGVSLADAVQSAHEEGQAFGESVARDAPALWLEAVLARKPRMPSDLEARLLQGSALPIDFLLHDEVRHALRRGFWDALDRARR